ncbi:MAG: serine hydrolase domain-containing protein [Bacillota bacterium]|nr:serine hydrolase domain-containing protein [Bacillota bacterium]
MFYNLFRNRSVKVLIFTLLIFITIISGCKSDTQEISYKNLSIQLESDIDKYYKDFDFSGNILVAKGENILFKKSYGFSDIEQKTLNTSETRFLIGSLAKQFTGMAIMQLVERGMLNVDDKIIKYIDGFPEGNKITIQHLLTHTSGLERDIKFDPIPSPLPTNQNEAIELIKSSYQINLLFTPGESFSYSNLGYELLGYIIEKVSGMSYKDYLEKNIFTPLNMTNTGFGYDRYSNKLLALGYNLKKECLIKDKFIDLTLESGAAGIYSTVEDLYKWDRSLYKNKLVSKKSMENIFNGGKFKYGYGWYIESDNGQRIYKHTGLEGGFYSFISRMVDQDVCIIILSNVDDDGTAAFNLNNLIIDRLKL